MMEQFMSNRQIASELAEFDEKTVTLYMVRARWIRWHFLFDEHPSFVLFEALQTILEYGVDQSHVRRAR